MLFTASDEQIKFFHLNKYLEIENVLDPGQVKSLLIAIDSVRAKSPGYPDENLFRSLEMIPMLIKKNGWGQIAAKLMYKNPLRILSDKFFASAPTDLKVPQEDCGLLISLKTYDGFFFQNSLPALLYKKATWPCLFLVLTANYLPDRLHPVVVK